ncbi:MAG: SDR family NAD(P)-dependent oxidoreductase, partial [Saprospiraceae bacterium]|nr:SDR family NAD(P)-dependent oxidoreductase [Saprospiraceae bacterium]
MDFTGKVVLVTGGSRGIGAAISKAFSERGAIIAINYEKNHERANQFLKNLSGSGHGLFRANIALLDDCKTLIEEVMQAYGRLDILVNNAGIHERHPIDETDYHNWDRIFHETLEVNLLGPARLMHLAVQQMQKQGSGRIINISSRGA